MTTNNLKRNSKLKRSSLNHQNLKQQRAEQNKLNRKVSSKLVGSRASSANAMTRVLVGVNETLYIIASSWQARRAQNRRVRGAMD